MSAFRSVAVLALAALAGAAQAQSQGDAFGRSAAPAPSVAQEPSDTYGIASRTVVSVGNWDFDPVDTTITYDQSCCAPYTKFRTGGTELWMIAPLNLPNGALVEEIQLLACDTSATAEVALFFVTQPNLGTYTETFNTTTGGAATPGCTTVTTAVAPPVTINNSNAFYGLEVAFTATGNATRLVGAKVAYRLQVSPAPAVAQFADVPVGHPVFRFVEALAASGITGGCGGGNYCPDAPLTRGQMAVFLSVALGLHFPN